ncbi:MAG: LysR family transcriptional regulator [Sphingomonadales bacterium]|nr:LysR family transcriptional regulator [Sphingomonadales bacterium]
MNLLVTSANAPLDMIEQQIDVALRVRTKPDGNLSLATRARASDVSIRVSAHDLARSIARAGSCDLGDGLSLIRIIGAALTRSGRVLAAREKHPLPRISFSLPRALLSFARAGLGA